MQALQRPQTATPFYHFPAADFPTVHPIDWLTSHFAVGGWSPINRLGDMLTAHMTQIAPRSGFTWHPHRGLEIYTWVLEGTLHHEDSVGGAGDIGALELQRMFAGDYIEHQELNHTDADARVIQIWFVADSQHRGLEPHYQQTRRDELPARRVGDATIYSLIGDGSPMQQHMTGRLSATVVDAGGSTPISAPHSGENLFVYITDGAGTVELPANDGELMTSTLGQYDVFLAKPEMPVVRVDATPDAPLHYLSFYLPTFLQ